MEPAGWYADPDDPVLLMWWDGTGWDESRTRAMPVCAFARCERLTGWADSTYCPKHERTMDKRIARQQGATTILYGPVNPQVVCPHCQRRGAVRTKSTKQKQGISGGKATAAIMTAGLSLGATGLSRKRGVTQCHCGSCGMDWTV
jgi:hypothetical protein